MSDGNDSDESAWKRDLLYQFERDSVDSLDGDNNLGGDELEDSLQLGQPDTANDKPREDENGSEDMTDIIKGLNNPARDRTGELVKFVVTGVDQLFAADQRALLELDCSDNQAVLQLQEHLKLTGPVLLQWRAQLEAAYASQVSTSAQESSQGSAWSPTPGYLDSSGKRNRLETPMEKTVKGSLVTNKYNSAVPIKRNKVTRVLDRDGETMHARSAQRNRWEIEWELHRGEWTTLTNLAFPTFHSAQEVWSAAALSNAAHLIGWLRHSVAPHHLLNHLQKPVLADLTQGFREEILVYYRAITKNSTTDATTMQWLQEWSTRIGEAVTATQRAVLLNAKDDWVQLKGINYGDIPELKLCAPNYRANLSRYIICATVFQDEIATLIDYETPQFPTIVDCVRQLLSALESSSKLRSAFKSGKDSSEWSALSIFFSTLLLEGNEIESSHQSEEQKIQQDLFTQLTGLHSNFYDPRKSKPERAHGSPTRILTQNVRGFKQSERQKWLAAWRQEPRDHQYDVIFLQETHVTSQSEARALSEYWNRLWGLSSSEQLTSFWSISQDKRGGVGILVHHKRFQLAKKWKDSDWTERHLAIKIGTIVYSNIYTPSTRKE